MFLYFSPTNNAYAAAAARAQQMKANRQQMAKQQQLLQQQQLQQQQTQQQSQRQSEILQSGSASTGTTSQIEEDKFWKILGRSSEIWAKVVKRADKEFIVKHYIEEHQAQGATIARPPSFYATRIDELRQSNPQMLTAPFLRLLQVVAITEYDFDNGANKEALAFQVLGQDAYRANKQRLGLK